MYISTCVHGNLSSIGCLCGHWPQDGRQMHLFASVFAKHCTSLSLHKLSAPVAFIMLLFQIDTTTTTKGRRSGASELLRRIVRGRPGWFSTFLTVLRDTGHKFLYNELTGGSPDCDEQGDSSYWAHPSQGAPLSTIS